MSLMGTVTKMALGFAMAKGMDAVQQNGGLGKLMEGLSGAGGGMGQAGQAGGLGGLGDLMGKLGGGGAPDAAGAPGGLGGLGALLGGLAGGGAAAGGLEALLGQDNPPEEPDEDEMAKLMLRAMTQAARADGDIDAGEKQQLVGLLNDDPGNMDILKDILQQPVDAEALAADTPKGLETQVYTMSLNAINPDNQAEGQYLHSLASALGIQPATVNEIHDNMGAPRLYQ